MLQRIDIYIKYFNEKYFAKMRRLIFYFLVCIKSSYANAPNPKK